MRQILLPPKGVHQPPLPVVGDGVDGKVPPCQIFLHLWHKLYPVRVTPIGVAALGAEGGGLVKPASLFYGDGAVLQAGGDAVFRPKQLHYLPGQGTGAQVPVLRAKPQQTVPDAASHHKCLIACGMEPLQQRRRPLIQPDVLHGSASSYRRVMHLPSKPHSAAGKNSLARGSSASGSRIMGE